MRQPRDQKLSCWIENDFANIAYELAAKREITVSAYLRRLVIEDLYRSGVINVQTVAKITT